MSDIIGHKLRYMDMMKLKRQNIYYDLALS